MGFFSTPETNAALKGKALAAYSKLDRLENRQKVGELFINNPTINGYIFNPSVEIQARRLKQQYNNKGVNTIEAKDFGKYYFNIGKNPNNDFGGQSAMNDILAQAGTQGLGMRIAELIEKKMKLEGKDQDIAYQILLDSVNSLPKVNENGQAMDDLVKQVGNFKIPNFGGGNAKKNHKRERKTKRARKTRRTRRSNKKRSA
jgi:hypothetical protein